MYTPPNTQEIINEYESTYANVEEKSLSGAFRHGLDAIKAELRACNITGEKAAAHMIQYITTATINVVTNSQQTTLNLVTSAYSLPKDLEFKDTNQKLAEEQKNLTEEQKNLTEEQKKTVAELRQYDVEYKNAQANSLKESLVQNTLIRVNTEANNMIGALSAHGVVPPSSLYRLSALASERALRLLKTAEVNGQNNTVPMQIRLYNGHLYDQNNMAYPAVIREYRLPPNDRWSYEIVLFDGKKVTGTDLGGTTVHEEDSNRALASVYVCRKVDGHVFTDTEINALKES